MIQELLIKNFAIIEESHIVFEKGMTVLTGETGAGKSIIIDAIGQLLGDRAKGSMVKNGADKAYIEAIIDIEDLPKVKEKLEETHIDFDDDLLYISKEILSNGKSVSKINYRNVPATFIRQIMPLIIDLHSQFDNTELLNEKSYLGLLDGFCDDNFNNLLSTYQEKYQQYRFYLKQKDELINEQDLFEQIDFYQTQLNEINQFDFENESVEELEEEQTRLQNYEHIQKSMTQYKGYMQSDQGALSSLYNAIQALDDIKEIDGFDSLYDQLYDLYYKIDDVNESILDIYLQLDYDEYRYNEIQEKLYVVQRLKKKYGPSIDMVLEKRDELLSKIQYLNNKDNILEELETKIVNIEKECMEYAKKIHDIRCEKAKQLSSHITEELKSLYMEHAIFEIVVTDSALHQKGCDEVKFMITTNLGQLMHPLSSVASGGELSRIMLALKTILLENTSIKTIIFDEVDTGVSGKVAFAIGQKMYKISKNKQVLCITHLPQVACFASHHLYVSKYIENNDIKTNVQLLNQNERIEEIAKMLSGDIISEEALKQSNTLLKQVEALSDE